MVVETVVKESSPVNLPNTRPQAAGTVVVNRNGNSDQNLPNRSGKSRNRSGKPEVGGVLPLRSELPKQADQNLPKSEFTNFTKGSNLDSEWETGQRIKAKKSNMRIEFRPQYNKVYWVYRWQLKDNDDTPITYVNDKGKTVYKRGYEYGGEIEQLPNDAEERFQEYKSNTAK